MLEGQERHSEEQAREEADKMRRSIEEGRASSYDSAEKVIEAEKLVNEQPEAKVAHFVREYGGEVKESNGKIALVTGISAEKAHELNMRLMYPKSDKDHAPMAVVLYMDSFRDRDTERKFTENRLKQEINECIDACLAGYRSRLGNYKKWREELRAKGIEFLDYLEARQQYHVEGASDYLYATEQYEGPTDKQGRPIVLSPRFNRWGGYTVPNVANPEEKPAFIIGIPKEFGRELNTYHFEWERMTNGIPQQKPLGDKKSREEHIRQAIQSLEPYNLQMIVERTGPDMTSEKFRAQTLEGALKFLEFMDASYAALDEFIKKIETTYKTPESKTETREG